MSIKNNILDGDEEEIMSMPTELPCWEIVQCNKRYQCQIESEVKKDCWDLVREDDACSFHICIDCLVYLAKQEDSLFTKEEFSSILENRKIMGIQRNECRMSHSLF